MPKHRHDADGMSSSTASHSDPRGKAPDEIAPPAVDQRAGARATRWRAIGDDAALTSRGLAGAATSSGRR